MDDVHDELTGKSKSNDGKKHMREWKRGKSDDSEDDEDEEENDSDRVAVGKSTKINFQIISLLF